MAIPQIEPIVGHASAPDRRRIHARSTPDPPGSVPDRPQIERGIAEDEGMRFAKIGVGGYRQRLAGRRVVGATDGRRSRPRRRL